MLQINVLSDSSKVVEVRDIPEASTLESLYDFMRGWNSSCIQRVTSIDEIDISQRVLFEVTGGKLYASAETTNKWYGVAYLKEEIDELERFSVALLEEMSAESISDVLSYFQLRHQSICVPYTWDGELDGDWGRFFWNHVYEIYARDEEGFLIKNIVRMRALFDLLIEAAE